MSLEFDVRHLVPSMRDLVAGVAMRRRSLSLVPMLRGELETVKADVSRLDGVVRAYATDAVGDAMRAVSRECEACPLLALAECRTAADCQRARFFGADGVAIAHDTEDPLALSKSARSMHMMPLFVLDGSTRDENLVTSERSALLLRGSLDHVRALAEATPTKSVVVVDGSSLVLDPSLLRAFLGTVDAVIVSEATHRAPWFAAVADDLDG